MKESIKTTYQQHSVEVFQRYFVKYTKAWFSPARLIYSRSLSHNITSNRTGVNAHFYRTEKNLSKWIYENERKWEKHIQDAERLAEKLQKCPCLYEKGNKIYKERGQKENVWRAVGQFLIVFFMNNKGPRHTLKGNSFFFITFARKFILQIKWSTILYHWHASPAVNHGKLLVLSHFLLIYSWW